MKHLSLLLCCVIALMLQSCVFSDKDAEQKLNGTWRHTETETEDGATMKCVENISYNASDHTFTIELEMKIVSPVVMELGSLTASGTWKASSDKIMGEINPESVNVDVNSAVVDGSDAEEMRSEMMRELESSGYVDGGLIRSLTDSQLVLYDEVEHVEYTYTKVN